MVAEPALGVGVKAAVPTLFLIVLCRLLSDPDAT